MLKVKLIAYAVVGLILALIVWKGLAFVYDSGFAAGEKAGYGSRQEEVQSIAKELSEVSKERDSYVSLYDRERLSSLLLGMEQSILVSRLQSSLEDMKDRLKKAQSTVQIREVIKYVPVEADRSCIVPNGFVLLHDWSTAPEDGAPPSPGSDVGEASGITLSQVAATVAANNAECHARGGVIEAWQTWYAESQRLIDKHNKELEKK